MDVLFSVIFGASAKLYDDLIDNKMIGDNLLKHIIYLITMATLSAISYKDFLFSIVLLIVNFGNHIANPDGFADNEWKALLYVYPLFVLSALGSITMPSLLEVGVLFFSFIIFTMEPLIIDEEFSVLKLITRLILLCGNIISYILMKDYVSFSIQKVQFTFIGYVLVSVLSQIYLLYVERQEIEGYNVRSLPDCLEHAYKNIQKLFS
jgi:hypothetical protein